MRHYIKRLSAGQGEYELPSMSPFSHPLHPRTNSPPADKSEYQQLVGQITYCAYAGRPDVAVHASLLGRHSSNPSIAHLAAARKTIRYLLSTPDLGLEYHRTNAQQHSLLSAYSDSDWAADLLTRKSQSGSAIYLHDCLVDWSSKRQATVATSTQEAELTAAVSTTSNILYLRDFLASIGMPQSTTSLFLDNKAAIDAGVSLAQPQSKHVALRLQFIRDYVSKKAISLIYVPTHVQKADIFTKIISGVKFQQLRDLLGIC